MLDFLKNYINKSVSNIGNIRDLLPVHIVGDKYAIFKNGYLFTGFTVHWGALFSMQEEEIKNMILKPINGFGLSAESGTIVSFQNVYFFEKSDVEFVSKNYLDESQARSLSGTFPTHYSYIFVGYPLGNYNYADFICSDDLRIKKVLGKSKNPSLKKIDIEKYVEKTTILANTISNGNLIRTKIMGEADIKYYLRSYVSLNWKDSSSVSINNNLDSLMVGDKFLNVVSVNKNTSADFRHFSYPNYSVDFRSVSGGVSGKLPASFTHKISLGLPCDHITTLSFVIQDSKKYSSRLAKYFKNNNFLSFFDENSHIMELTKGFCQSISENIGDKIVTYNLNTMVFSGDRDTLKDNLSLTKRAYSEMSFPVIQENFQNLIYFRGNIMGNVYSIPRQLLSSFTRMAGIISF